MSADPSGYLLAKERSAGSMNRPCKEDEMIALLALLVILAVFGGLGFAAHFLWIVLVVALLLWVVGFFVGGVEAAAGAASRRRRWYGR